MIKSTHPQFERLVAGESLPASEQLLDFLQEAGVPHESDSAGIRLAPGLELLDPEKIAEGLRTASEHTLIDQLPLEIHRVIGSTNDRVMQCLARDDCDSLLCTAEMQTAGKGRRGRSWVSPFGSNVYVTYGRFLQRKLSGLGGLSLVVGMQAIDTLRAMGLKGAALKWPNDILLREGKLGGILVELRPQEKRGIGVVAGMGVNFLLSQRDAGLIEQSWSVIGDRASLSRNRFLGEFAARLVDAFELFNRHGFQPFADRWDQYDAYPGEVLRILRGDQEVVGENAGIDEAGNLLVQTDLGLQVHNAGEVSMRRKSG